MTTIRSAKTKGSQFEMDCEYSLRRVCPDIRRLGGEGQFREADLESRDSKYLFECKRHKAFSWNELKGYLMKLKNRAPEGYYEVLLFKANNQPCLMMATFDNGQIRVLEFEDFFGVPFEKHKSTKIKKEEIQ